VLATAAATSKRAAMVSKGQKLRASDGSNVQVGIQHVTGKHMHQIRGT